MVTLSPQLIRNYYLNTAYSKAIFYTHAYRCRRTIRKVNHSPITIRVLNSSDETAEIIELWTDLLIRSEHRFFLSKAWISCWLNSLPKQHSIYFCFAFKESRPIMAILLGENTKIRNYFVKSRGMYLNSTGNKIFDEVTTEYNSLLIDKSLTKEDISESLKSIFSALDNMNWNELFLPASTQSTMNLLSEYFANYETNRFRILCPKEKASHFVDLEKVESDQDYLQMISRNSRSKIRQSLKAYEQYGPIEIVEASSTNQALSMFDNLIDLHQQEWVKRGKKGAFANNYLKTLHKTLITEHYNEGTIQLIEVRAGSHSLGYLYNFVYQDRVYFYQCGFNYSENTKHRPGLVSHFAAIVHNANKGKAEYDFLAGDARYKSSLSTNHNNMYWLVVQKKQFRFSVELRLKKLKQICLRNYRRIYE